MVNVIADCWIATNSRSSIFQLNISKFLTIFETNSDIINDDNYDIKISSIDGNLIQSPTCIVNDLNNNHIDERKQTIDWWLQHVKLAKNCFEQNLIAFPVNMNNIVFNHQQQQLNNNYQLSVYFIVIKPIKPGECLYFWPWIGLSMQLGIPIFLSPRNILNNHCYICYKCGISYTQPNPLKIHLMFKCCTIMKNDQEIFNQTSSSSSAIYQNQQIMNNNDTISNSSTTETTTTSTINNNNGNLTKKLHTCSYCGKVYTRKYGLKIHIRTHTGVKPLSCRYCGRSFSDPSNLNKHMRLHQQHLSTQTTTLTTSTSTSTSTTTIKTTTSTTTGKTMKSIYSWQKTKFDKNKNFSQIIFHHHHNNNHNNQQQIYQHHTKFK